MTYNGTENKYQTGRPEDMEKEDIPTILKMALCCVPENDAAWRMLSVTHWHVRKEIKLSYIELLLMLVERKNVKTCLGLLYCHIMCQNVIILHSVHSLRSICCQIGLRTAVIAIFDFSLSISLSVHALMQCG